MMMLSATYLPCCNRLYANAAKACNLGQPCMNGLSVCCLFCPTFSYGNAAMAYAINGQ